ncbi:hypothetical protein R5W24_006338 [Gemmata sp. JC717]|uniref:hypothetical protein n=1 Tax=Gemmata algarum TaxID=2975278 RepID=UPI0021BBA5F0|nr:hypothetical protein [Gemmata algarum]MDY3557151.1 hypothetical protein [Gemmata algarum]
MKRFGLATVLVAALGHSAGAQPAPTPAPTVVQPPPVYPPSTPPPPAPPVGVTPTLEAPPVGAPAPNVFVPPGTPPGPAFPFAKSGGLVVGVYGYYPYDTGVWLRGGTDGLTRQSGAFTMVYPESTGVVVGPVSHGHFHGKLRCGPFGR